MAPPNGVGTRSIDYERANIQRVRIALGWWFYADLCVGTTAGIQAFSLPVLIPHSKKRCCKSHCSVRIRIGLFTS